MSRGTRVLAVTTLIAVAASVWLYFDNRSLRTELSTRPAIASRSSDASTTASTGAADPWLEATRRSATIPKTLTPEPALPAAKEEHRLDRRARRTEEFAAMFGRHDGETEDEYRARIGPLISAGLVVPRMRAVENRRYAEEKAGVTPAQSAKLDQAFEKVYGDVLDYTNKAIVDGVLSPYERNVAGWLDYAGGLGGMLTDAQGQIGKVLSADQMKAMSAAGFEWGEYLGLSAPWEKLTPPPPPK